jgi:hypothetical protein
MRLSIVSLLGLVVGPALGPGRLPLCLPAVSGPYIFAVHFQGGELLIYTAPHQNLYETYFFFIVAICHIISSSPRLNLLTLIYFH